MSVTTDPTISVAQNTSNPISFDPGTPHHYELLISYLKHSSFYFNDLVSNLHLDDETSVGLEKLVELITTLTNDLEKKGW